MTQDRDLETLLDGWFSDGPIHVADRVLDDVSRQIARQPQRPAWRLRPWRFPSMTPSARLALAAMAIVAVTTGLFIAIRPPTVGPGVVGSSTPSMTLAPSASTMPRPSLSPGAAACENDLSGCAGALAAGIHGSSHFGPRLIHYVTPAGWTNSIDTPTIYKLDAPQGAASILLWADVSVEDQTPTSCEPGAKGPGRASPPAAAWVSYLTTLPGLVTTTPAAVDFRGTRDEGTTSLDITMDPAWTQTCPGRTDPEVLFIAHTTPPLAAYGVGPADKLRLVVFDTASYGPHTVLIEVYGPLDNAGFSETVRITREVMDTFVFGCGPGAGYGPCGGYPFPST